MNTEFAVTLPRPAFGGNPWPTSLENFLTFQKYSPMKCTLFSTMIAVMFFTACSPGIEKKVMIMSSGKIQVDNNTKTITLEPGTQHNEAELSLSAKDNAITVKSPDGDKTYDLPEN